MTSPLSVIIAARNAEATIREQLIALTDQPWPNGGEIIVADNGSTDRTAEIVRAQANQVLRDDVVISVVDCQEMAGAGYARNVGARMSSYGHLAFCDADDVVDRDWVAAIGRALEKHEAVGGRLDLTRLNPKWTIHSRGSRLAGQELPKFDDIFPVLSSCNLGIRRSTFDALDGFDETYLRGQDAELSLRLYRAGVDAHFASDAVVSYRLQSSVRGIFSQARGWGEVNDRLRDRLAIRPKLRTSLRSWAWLAAHVHHLGDRSRRARWVYVAGLRVGLLRASISRHLRPGTAK